MQKNEKKSPASQDSVSPDINYILAEIFSEISKKTKYKTQFNENYYGVPGATLSSISETIPDQSMTAREILDKFARGIAPTVSYNQPQYLGEEKMFPDMTKLDLAERQELIELNRAYIQQLKDNLDRMTRNAEEQKLKEKSADSNLSALDKSPTGAERHSQTGRDNILKKPGSGQRPAAGGNHEALSDE